MKFTKLQVHSFQLQYYILFGLDRWTTQDPLKNFNLNFNDPSTLHDYFNFIHSASDYGKFLGYEYGFDSFLRNIIGDILMPIYLQLKDKDFSKMDLCLMMYFDLSDPELKKCEKHHQLQRYKNQKFPVWILINNNELLF